MTASKALDMKQLMEHLGGFGKFQIFVFVLGCYASAMPGLLVVNLTFVGFEPPHRCKVSLCESPKNTSYYASFLEFAIPLNKETEIWDVCHKYLTIDSQPEEPATCNADAFDSTQTTKCSEYVYDTSLFHTSIVTEFDLVCDKSWVQPAALSAYMVGMLIGAILLGDLADRYGRRLGFVTASTVFFIGGVLGAISLNYYMFLASRVITGVGSCAVFQVAFIITVEFVPPKWRAFVGILIMIPFSFGEAFVALLAYLIRDWRWLQAACILPSGILLLYFWIMPESIRWLISSGRREEATKIIKRIEKMNNLTIPKNVYNLIAPNGRKDLSVSVVNGPEILSPEVAAPFEQEKRNVLDLLRYPKTRYRTFNLIFCWIVVTLSYYGLSANSANLGGNIFVNFAAIMLIEVPSSLFAYFLLDRMGRKGTIFFVMLLGGIASLIAGFTPSHMELLIVTLSMGGKFGVSAGFSVVFVYTAEIYPTSYRSVGVGTCSMAARLGGIMAPFVANLGKVYRPLPLLIFGILAVISSLLIVILPETLGSELPQTLQESENLGADQSLLYFSCWPKKRKLSIEKIRNLNSSI